MEAEFSLKDGTSFLVEVDEPESRAIERVARFGRTVVKPKESFEEALDKVKPVAFTIVDKLHDLSAEEVEVKFGLKLTADAGVVFAKAGSEFNFEVTLSWQQNNAG